MPIIKERIQECKENAKTSNWDYEYAGYPRTMWGDEAGSGTTQLGYFDWVLNQLKSE